MARRELTDIYIKNLKVEKRTEVWDTKETGLLLRAFASGTKTFALRLRGADGEMQNSVIGHYPDVKLATARENAAELRKRAKGGEDVSTKAQKALAQALAEDKRSVPTLDDILYEYEAEMSVKRKIWRKTKTGKPSEARHRIETVFNQHFDVKVTDLTLQSLANSMINYVPESGKATANGQVSKARSYLMPVLDWCARRNRFDKVGLGRTTPLDVVDLHSTQDPAQDDHTIRGSRDRALDHVELGKILPLLVWPAPKSLAMRLRPEQDLRPIALRFLLLTGARRAELVAMKWGDFRENSGLWHKPYVKTISGPPRQQNLPLSDAAIQLLRSLPEFHSRRSDMFVFPNADGGPLGNLSRITKSIQRVSGTKDWHRHDLRRTASTIMRALSVPPTVIDDILAHLASGRDDGTSRALENYFSSQYLLEHVEDPQKVGLDRLAHALAHIESAAVRSEPSSGRALLEQ